MHATWHQKQRHAFRLLGTAQYHLDQARKHRSLRDYQQHMAAANRYLEELGNYIATMDAPWDTGEGP